MVPQGGPITLSIEDRPMMYQEMRCSYCQSPAADVDVLRLPWCDACRLRKWLINWGAQHHWLLQYTAHLNLAGVLGKDTWVAFVMSARDAEIADAWLRIALFERRRTQYYLGCGRTHLSLPPPDRDTTFAETTFRNEWEAKWACFFEHLALDYAYFRNGPNSAELPAASAFWLQSLSSYVVITGPFPFLRETEMAEHAHWFAMRTGTAVYLLEGRIGVPTHGDSYTTSLLTRMGEWKRPFTWHECLICGAVGLSHPLTPDSRICSCPDSPETIYRNATPRLVRAYIAARYAHLASPLPPDPPLAYAS